MIRNTALLVLALSCFILVAAVAAQKKGGRYDAEIKAGVARLLAGKSDYKNVHAVVEDSVVTLTGSVELDSTRRWLVGRVRRIAHVESVQNEIVLDPPAVPDQTLYGRVRRSLADAGFEKSVRFSVHEGAVTLRGTVANMKERQRATEVVRATEGVKEVENRLTAAGE